MANKNVHLLVGIGAGLGLYAFYKWYRKDKWTFEGAVGSAIGGALLALTPDILEPALKNPNHRQFFHSGLLLTMLPLLNYYIWKSDKLAIVPKLKLAISVLSVAYESHLLIDSQSLRGLPLI